MQVEIKMLLGDTSDYHRLTSALEPLYISEQSYIDYFFDFPSGALTAVSSVLRLRVPCVKPTSLCSPVRVDPGTSNNTDCNARPDLSNEHSFLSQPGSAWYDCSSQYRQPVAAAANRSDVTSLPQQPSVPEEAKHFGKLVLKQHNTVEKGHQMNFVVEDAQVPPEVVERFTSGRENPFDVLTEYAQQCEQLATGRSVSGGGGDDTTTPSASQSSPVTAAGRIVERLRYTAVRLQLDGDDSHNTSRYNGVGKGGCSGNYSADQNTSHDQEESSRYYGQMRYAAGMASLPDNAATSQLQRCDLVAMGNYTSTRKLYHYLQPRQGRMASLSASTAATAAQLVAAAQAPENRLSPAEQEELAWRSLLVIRVDKTLYPFGEKYELEVPRVDADGCGGLLGDVTEELSRFLTSLQVKFQLGSEGKYARFICGMRSLHADPQVIQDVKLRLTNASGYQEVLASLEQLTEGGGVSNRTRSGSDRGTEAGDGQRRHISNMDLDSSGTQRGGGPLLEGAAAFYTGSTELQVNYFFDGPACELAAQRCFLRLRHSPTRSRFELVLKEMNTFAEGTQTNRRSKTVLSEDVARALLDDPGTWLERESEHNAVAHTVWEYFGLRTLTPTVCFSTTRVTAPWWNARCQRATVRKSGDREGGGGGDADLSRLAFTQAGSYTQLEEQLRLHTGGEVVVPPLKIHLDCSQYRIPLTDEGRQRQQRIPFTPFTLSQSTATGVAAAVSSTANITGSSRGGGNSCNEREAVFELYEVEVTDIKTAAPSVVMEELVSVLDGLGVEWQTGVQSKLDQYYALARAVNGA